jgi:transcription elongation factor Elf1
MNLPTKKNTDQYVDNNNSECPFCGNQSLEAISEVQTENNIAWVEIHCVDCEKVWRDEYKLTSISIMTVNKNNEHDRWYSDEAAFVRDMYIHEYQDVIDQHNEKR